MNSGVPHGSVLGPILFLVFINDLPNKIRSKVRLFADDTAVYLAVSNIHDAKILQANLDQLQLWEKEWDMQFNPSKCTVLHITRSKKHSHHNMDKYWNGQAVLSIYVLTSAKIFLGTVISRE